MSVYLISHDCLLEEYLAGLNDEIIADLYAMRKGFTVCPGLPLRYKQLVVRPWGTAFYYLAPYMLPTRQEMIAEIIQQETLP
jgi:hypothetical protein